ncbi:hypothetical protein OUZ56_015917 [Daphnia magna]|uniref:Uncharacterized protein n=1 Tax=Daphnia magna TaxID=35525 RepID=A0ABR0APK3_9CRUS|nr:hypothetical protein OUZ56_015917 [Daphnia magna]
MKMGTYRQDISACRSCQSVCFHAAEDHLMRMMARSSLPAYLITTEKEKKKSNEKIIGEMEDLHYKSQGLGSLISVDNYVYYIQRKQVSYPSVSNYLAESVKMRGGGCCRR